MAREIRHVLFDILEHIQRCEKLAGGRTATDLQDDFATRMALERAIEIISEASRHITEADKATEPSQPWRNIADIGNHLRHAYHLTAVELVHAVATEGVAKLKPTIERLYARHKRPEDPWPNADAD